MFLKKVLFQVHSRMFSFLARLRFLPDEQIKTVYIFNYKWIETIVENVVIF